MGIAGVICKAHWRRKKHMRRLLLLIALSVMGAGQMKATPLACATGQTLAYYETTYTSQASACSIAGLDFYDFNAAMYGVIGNSGPGTAPFTAASIDITPVDGPGGVGFLITPVSTFQATATGVRDVDIPIQVVCDNGMACLTSIFMSISGSATASNVSGGTAGEGFLTESYCPGSVVPPCSGGSGTQDITLAINPSSPSTVSQTVPFSGVSGLSLDKDIGAIGNNGSATVTSVEDLFSVAVPTSVPTPEPSTLLLLEGGLIGLALFSIRRRLV
jgi:hypothetical protein